MKIQILAFGRAKEMLNFSAAAIDVQSRNAGDLKMELLKNYPSLADLSSFQIAINENYALAQDRINENDTIAIIPPVSGG